MEPKAVDMTVELVRFKDELLKSALRTEENKLTVTSFLKTLFIIMMNRTLVL